MSARDVILGRIRAARGQAGSGTAPHPRPGPGTIPVRGQGTPDERVRTFISEAEQVGATTARVAGAGDVPGALAAYLAGRNMPRRVRLAPAAEAFPWETADTLETMTGRAEDSDGVGVSVAFAGVAETGTLVLLSGADNPTRLNFLVETHVVVIDAATIEGAYEDVWKTLRTSRANETTLMPRTVNWITGPSRTADIEQTLLMGAHGPKDLHIIVVGDA